MKAAKFVFQFLVLAIGSLIAGFIIAVIVHYVSFGIWGYGFGKEASQLALVEGGMAGIMMAIPTGAIIYYGVFRRRVTLKEVRLIVFASLGGGLIIGVGTVVVAMLLIPIWTIAVALWAKRRREPARTPQTWVA